MIDAMKTLILYASRKGQTEKIAKRLARRLEEIGHDVTVGEVDSPRSVDLEPYELVVLGSSVKFGKHSGAIADFVRANRSALAGRATAFFSVGASAIPGTPGGQEAARKQIEDFFVETAWQPTLATMFAGAVPYTQHDPISRLVLKRMQRRSGRSTDTSTDYEYTDWDAVEWFAGELDGAIAFA